jgi:hypothetical protein
MPSARRALWSAAFVPLSVLGCSDRNEVDPIILSITTLTANGTSGIYGELRVRYENTGDDTLILKEPQLQLIYHFDGGPNHAVDFVDLGLPAEFDRSFDVGQVSEALISISGLGNWRAYCDPAVTAQVRHWSVAPDGSGMVSLSPEVPVDVICQP